MNAKYLIAFALVFLFACTQEAPASQKVEQGDKDPCPYTYMSWNLLNFGKSKSDDALRVMAKVLAPSDVIGVQEVNAGKEYGAQAIAKLVGYMNEEASKLPDKKKHVGFDYVVSNPTMPRNTETERYAFIIRKGLTFSRDSATLVTSIEKSVSREPYAVTVSFEEKSVTFFTFHAVPSNKAPLEEVRRLTEAQEITSPSHAIFSGDFNIQAGKINDLFASMGYGYDVVNTRTTLRKEYSANRGYLFQEFDHIFPKGVKVCKSGAVDFVNDYFRKDGNVDVVGAHKVSDHLPVFVRFGF